MKSTLETLEDNRVKLSVEVDESEFDTAVNAAFKRIAKEVRMPGFRPGKAPRRLLEAQFGHQVGRDEALREAMPEYYAQAVIEHDVDVVGPPDIEMTGGQETGVVEFDAVVEIRPTVNAGGYDGLRIEIPSPSPSDEEVDEQLEQMRKHYAELEVVERAAVDGDHVTIDISGTHGEEEIPGLTTTDYDYEVGSGAVVAEIDDHLRGASVGDELEFEAEHPDPDEEDPIAFAISVKEVKEAVLPELDDAWAAETSEFETVEELRADMVERLSSMRVAQARSAVQQNTAEALASLVLDEIPESMIDNEVNARIQDMVQRLQQQGMEVSAYLEAMGMTAESLAAEFREPAEQAVRVDLALRSVAEAEGMNPDDEKLDEQLEEMAGMSGQSATELRERLAEVGQLSVLRADLGKQAAMEWLTENVELIDENGDPIDRATLEIPEEEADIGSDSAEIPGSPDSPDSVDSPDSEEE
ncbi:MAG: trigger factor [Acidimicrobiales bacterium]|nr:trigger factor [Acidimicrobiales bacterium]MDG2218131.1 trigger factor [Acidimicrobiales bacterium]